MNSYLSNEIKVRRVNVKKCKYIMKEIYTDGYERIAVLKGMEIGEKIIVHFLEYDEYLENGVKTEKKKAGDVIEGELSIDLVTVNKKTNKEVMHKQIIKKSSHIEAIVEVFHIVDNFSLYAFSTIANDEILIEFESAIDYKVGDRIFIEGSLEMREI